MAMRDSWDRNRNKPPHSNTRRRFLKRAAAVVLGAPGVQCALHLASGRRAAAAADSVGIGLIGCGDLGVKYHLRKYLQLADVRVVAVCDVDRARRDKAAKLVAEHYGGRNRPGSYNDYRELLDRGDVDAVIVVTPDHWHALQTIHACQAGKDVHCEKPLSLTVAEGRAMVAAARRHARVVQTGSESRSKGKVRLACELVRNGRIGKLLDVRTGLGRNPVRAWSPPGKVPAGLDWNLWLGPAPSVPYHRERCHYTFRWFRDYSGGKLTDWGAHMNDVAQWGMGADTTGPVRIEAARARYAPDNMYEFPPEFAVTYTYASGVKLVSTSESPHVTFRGTRGSIRTGLDGIQSDPPAIAAAAVGPDDVRLYASSDHDRNWLDCIRTRRRPVADIEIGHRTATVCHLGNIALWLNRPLSWDPELEEFDDDEDANRHLSRPLRAPWRL